MLLGELTRTSENIVPDVTCDVLFIKEYKSIFGILKVDHKSICSIDVWKLVLAVYNRLLLQFLLILFKII